MRCATARAAMRRGSSIRIFRLAEPCAVQESQRDDGALAGARRRTKQHARVIGERVCQRLEGLADRQRR